MAEAEIYFGIRCNVPRRFHLQECLAFAGALAGVGGAAILFSSGKFSFFPVFELTPRIAGLAFLIGGLLGVISMLAPAWSVSRMSVFEGLKTLD